MSAHGAFHWNELNTRNVQKAKDFYAKTLGWTYEDTPMGDGTTYILAYSNGQMVGGIFEMVGTMFEGVPEHWFSYIAVDDVDKRAAAVKAAGGTVIREPFDVPMAGRIAILRDPNGAHIGFMTPAEGLTS